jgi:hypothetical protein
MTFGATSAARPLATLVLRLWLPGQGGRPQVLYLQVTHVQTGEVAYFRTIDGVAQYVDGLAKRLGIHAAGQPPIYLSEVRRRSEES